MRYIKTQPLFLYLLPVFFILHEAAEYYYFVTIKDAFILIAVYLGVSLFLSLSLWVFYRDFYKSALITFVIMAFNFFFGNLHDLLKNTFPDMLIARYSFILPFSAIVFVVLLIYLKKTKRNFYRVGMYLNSLFLILIMVDVITLFLKMGKSRQNSVFTESKEFISCDSCSRPDIYLVITDEYAGKEALQDIFEFNNAEFELEIKNRGFHIIQHSKSNYNTTAYSMASILNMDYLKFPESTIINQEDILTCLELIKKNNLLYFLQKNEYEIYNYSFFDLDKKKKTFNNFYFPSINKIINSQTLVYRFIKDLGFHFASRQKLERIKKNNLYNNKEADSLTRMIALKTNTRPKFVYTHLSMPHHPYYFDRNEKEASYEMLTENYDYDKKAYIEYLLYTNKKILALVDYIKKVSSKLPIIILMSDHGFRQLTKTTDVKYHFMTLNSVYFPNGNYSLFYEGMSNVNQFRVVLNTQFGQKLSLLKDSSIFYKE